CGRDCFQRSATLTKAAEEAAIFCSLISAFDVVDGARSRRRNRRTVIVATNHIREPSTSPSKSRSAVGLPRAIFRFEAREKLLMNRRAFILALGGAAAWPLEVGAQRGRMRRIGLLAPGRSVGADASLATLNSVVTGLRELGYVEGQTIAIERGFGEANADRLREVAAELVGHALDVIVALSTTAPRPLTQSTSVIPIVVVGMADPVEDELVASLARPGGNVTGTTFLGPELVAKRLQLLSEVVPQHSRVAVLWHPHAYSDRTMAGMLKEAEHAAEILGMQLQFLAAASPDDIQGAFSSMASADALSVFPSP